MKNDIIVTQQILDQINTTYNHKKDTLEAVEDICKNFVTANPPMYSADNPLYSLGSMWYKDLQNKDLMTNIYTSDLMLQSISYLHFLQWAFENRLITATSESKDRMQLLGFDNTKAMYCKISNDLVEIYDAYTKYDDVITQNGNDVVLPPIGSLYCYKLSDVAINSTNYRDISSSSISKLGVLSPNLINSTEPMIVDTYTGYQFKWDVKGEPYIIFNSRYVPYLQPREGYFKHLEGSTNVEIPDTPAEKYNLLWNSEIIHQDYTLFERYGRFLWDKEANTKDYHLMLQFLVVTYTNTKTYDVLFTTINTMFGMPFSKHLTETVVKVVPVSEGDNIIAYHIITDKEVYATPGYVKVLVEVGDVITQFTLLASFVKVFDVDNIIRPTTTRDVIWYEDSEFPWNLVVSSEFQTKFYDGELVHDGRAFYGLARDLRAEKSTDPKIATLMDSMVGNGITKLDMDDLDIEKYQYAEAYQHYLYLLLKTVLLPNLIKIEAEVNLGSSFTGISFKDVYSILDKIIPVYMYVFIESFITWKGDETGDNFRLDDRDVFAIVTSHMYYHNNAEIMNLPYWLVNEGGYEDYMLNTERYMWDSILEEFIPNSTTLGTYRMDIHLGYSLITGEEPTPVIIKYNMIQVAGDETVTDPIYFKFERAADGIYKFTEADAYTPDTHEPKFWYLDKRAQTNTELARYIRDPLNNLIYVDPTVETLVNMDNLPEGYPNNSTEVGSNVRHNARGTYSQDRNTEVILFID